MDELRVDKIWSNPLTIKSGIFFFPFATTEHIYSSIKNYNFTYEHKQSRQHKIPHINYAIKEIERQETQFM
jgi:hypothetical protein